MAVAAEDVRDLGRLDGPVLVFGGAYSNLQALEAMLAVARELRVPAQNIIHTGDVVAYCAQPLETSLLLQASGVHCLLGNCEESVGVGKHDCGCGFPEDSACNAYSVNWYAHVTKELAGRDDLTQWMGSMPRRIEFVVAGRRLAVVHGSPRDISEFVWPSTPDSELEACFAKLPASIDGVIGGHSGIPFAKFLPAAASGGRRLWLNAGVIGMPANDGTERGWFTILTPLADGSLSISVHPLHYNAKKAADEIFARPQLVRGYADSLLSGIWPSHDVLPVQDQMNTGMELKEHSVVWPRDPADDGRRRASGGASALARSLGAPALLAVALAGALAAFGLARRRGGLGVS